MAEIERRIARTRAELGLTLDAAAIELAPRHLVEQGVEMITDFLRANRPDGIGFGASFRADPVPLALIGLGAAWLVAENLGLVGGITPGDGGAPPSEAGAPAQRIAERAEPVLDGDVPHTGEGWMQRAAGVAQGAVRSIVADGGAALERAGDYLGKALPSSGSAQRAGGWLKGRHPLLLGAVGLAAGAAISALLPTSRREQEIVGEAREDLWEKAEEFGHRAAEGVRSLADGPNPPCAGGITGDCYGCGEQKGTE
ncbi:MAG TPA: DUF3618 domain-containing protein [Stellaceae bacterium]|jgi:hypothetical protein